jgi:pimeloyl-ACP methyl ester carboxylesterase
MYIIMKLLLILLIPLVSCAQTVTQDSTYPKNGRLVNIGERKLYLQCSGKGGPTILLVAGGGAFAIDWWLVQSQISATCRVCAFDRAGLGWSDSGPDEETVEETVSDLHTLLAAAQEKGPYLLVGASIGGIFIQAYQNAFPKEVAGLVFSNSSNHIGFASKDKTGLIWDLSDREISASFPLPPRAKKFVSATTVPDPFSRLPQEMQQKRLWLTNQLFAKWDTSKSTPASMLSWRKEFLREFEESAANSKPLGQLPVVVIASDPQANDSVLRTREGAAGLLDFLSANTIHITATGSGHEIHLYQADTVIKGLKIAVEAIRKNISLSEALKKIK